MMWNVIGKNIFLNNIYENEDGVRKIFKNGIEIIEKEKSFEFGRILNPEQEKILLKNLINKEFLDSYNRSLNKIYFTFYKDKHENFSKEDKNYLIFLDKYKKYMYLTFIEIWKKNLSVNMEHIKWENWMGLKNDSNFLLGVQYGLSLFLNERKEKILEFGLKNDLNSSLLSYVKNNRYIFTQNQNKSSFAPFSYLENNNFPISLYKILTNTINGFNNKDKKLSKEQLLEKISNMDFSKMSLEDINQKALNYFLNDKAIKLIWNTFNEKTEENKKAYIEIIKKFILNKEKVIFVCQSLNDEFQKSFINKDFILQCEKNGIFIKRKILLNEIKNEENYTKEDIKAVIWFFSFSKTTNLKDYESLKSFSYNKNFWKNKEQKNLDLIEGDRVFYQSVSNSTKPSSMVSSKISEEIYQSLLQIKKEHKDLDQWIAKLLKINKEDLPNRLSSEQIDAISLGVSSLLKKKGLIIADETGFGKGRILAAIAIIGINLGKSVFFFTENKQLFSDFYRDILAVKEEEKIIPLILNQSGKIFDPDGNLIVNQLTPKKFKDLIENKNWDKNEQKFLITNYAQINKKGIKQPKMEFLKRLQTEQNWIILDEAHNASGDSNINENLKYLIENAEGVIFSSATFAKNEDKLSIYDKAIPLSEMAKDLVKLALFGDQGDLRELITKEMAKQGNYIRREHPPIDLPEIMYVDNNQLEQRMSLLSEMWKKIFSLVELREEMLGYFSAKAWLSLGSVLNRCVREFIFLNKVEGVLPKIEEIIKQNKKIVLVTEITFEAALKELVEGNFLLEENIDNEINEENIFSEDVKIEKNKKEAIFEEKPNWCWKWLNLLDKITDLQSLEKELLFRRRDPEFDEDKFNQLKPLFLSMKDDVEKEILKNDYFSLFPLDELKNNLKMNNIIMTELSGRTYQCVKKKENNKDIWVINNKLEKIERTQLVSDFNSGKNDVILVTRSGASGISLHAGAKFKDQRQRVLMELDISSNSANRIQFLGRVRRKDQVIEPEFFTPLLKITSDIRKMEIEKRKQIKLSAHIGGRKENNVLDWISEEGELIIEEWGKENKSWAKKIGAFNVDINNEVKRIDRSLTRSLILPKNEQDILLKRIEKGIKCHTNFHFYRNTALPISKKIFSKPLWGNFKTKTETDKDDSILNLGYITLNYRLWSLNNNEEIFDNGLLSQFLKDTETYLKSNDYTKKIEILINNWEEVIAITENKYSKIVLQSLKEFFNKIVQGQMFILGFKNNLYSKIGCIIDINLPDIDNNFEQLSVHEKTIEMISAYSLNTISIKVLFENDLEYVDIPLYILLKDETFKPLPLMFNKDNFYKKDNYLNTLTIEGNPILCSVWNKKTKIGKIETINDEEEKSKTILLLPKQLKMADFDDFNIPFINLDQIRDYLYQNQEKYIINGINKENANMVMRIVKRDKYEIEVLYKNQEDYKKHLSKWLLKAHSFIKDKNFKSDGKVEIIFYSHKLYQIISLLQEEGIFFFCPKNDKKWFENNVSKIIKNNII